MLQNDSHYCILYGNNIPIDFIHDSGEPVYSPGMYKKFYTHHEAVSELHRMLNRCINKCSPNFGIGNLSAYTVAEVKTQYYADNNEFSKAVTSWYNITEDGCSEHAKKALLRLGVHYGFDIANVDDNLLTEILTSPKYSDIVSQVVPNHMIENRKDFMSVGITTCSEDEIAAILMTTPDEVLEYIFIDRYNISR